jgi:hypothetical protein
MATQATRISGAAFFKHKYLTNLSVTPEDLVIAATENLTQALETSIPQHLRVSTIQALIKGPLRSVYRCILQLQ